MHLEPKLEPDLPLAARYLAGQPIPGRLVLCAVTGSHHYGFSSPDSDLDLKAVHLAPLDRVIGLHGVPDTFDRIEWFEGVECDLTSHEAAKALRLLLRGNGNLLERLASPYQVVRGEQTEGLQALLPGAISKRAAGHYGGYLRGMQAEHLRDGFKAKSMLYAYRVALTGIELLQTGAVVAHLPTLASKHGFEELLALIALKTSTAEKVVLSEPESERYRERWPELAQRLEAALASSPLPDEPPGAEAAERWLVQSRLNER